MDLFSGDIFIYLASMAASILFCCIFAPMRFENKKEKRKRNAAIKCTQCGADVQYERCEYCKTEYPIE